MLESKKQAPRAEHPTPSTDKTVLAPKLAPSSDTGGNAKWLQKFLESSVFLRLPASNLQALVARMDEVPAHQGQVVIHQGGRANNYYIVKTGSCQVLRQTQNSEHPIQLAVLQAGDGFGEDALITRGRRNASVIMLEDGCLMRLSRHNFTSLLVNPVLKSVSVEQALQRAEQGSQILDVRAPHEFRRSSASGSINIPLPLLRANLTNLDPSTEYITYCNSGTLSAAAAFVLAQHGYNCVHVSDNVKQKTIRKPSRADMAESTTRTMHAPRAEVATTTTRQTPKNTIEQDPDLLWTSIPLPTEFDQTKLYMIEPRAELSKACTQQNTSVRCLETQEDIAWAQSWEKPPTRPAQTNRKPEVSIPNWTSTRYAWESIMGYGESRAARFDRKTQTENSSPLAMTQRQGTPLTLSEKASANHIEHKKTALRSLMMMRHRARITITLLLIFTAALASIFPDSAQHSFNWAMQQIKPDRQTATATLTESKSGSSVAKREATNTARPTTRHLRPVIRQSHIREQASSKEAAPAPHPNTNTPAADIF